jgi:triosephosphate isomerase
MRPLVCVGERLEERECGTGPEVVARQLRRAFQGVPIEMAGRLMVAYEPVWAIGEHGNAASADNLRVMQEHIRGTLAGLFGSSVSTPVLYGGTVNERNAVSLLVDGGVDGLFIGRAAWEADGFARIIRACVNAAVFSKPGVCPS